MMECVKEETDPESFTITPQHTQQQTDLVEVKKEDQDHNEMKDEDQDHNYMTDSFSETDEKSPQERDEAKNVFACHLCDLEVKEEDQEHKEMKDEHQDHNYMAVSCSETDQKSPQERVEAKDVFACHLCDKTYSLKVNLTRHLKLHDERPHACSQCEKTFLHKSQLRYHVMSHTDLMGVKEEDQEHNEIKDEHQDDNFLTDSCSETEENSSQESTKAKNVFACHLCAKTFSRKGYLRYHLKIHSGDRPHACSHCEKTFIQNSHLMFHIKAARPGQ
nr:gastrula zinc finger protein xFG20-1-like isoform X4 [Misgurnus anguillicaudatus]